MGETPVLITYSKSTWENICGPPLFWSSRDALIKPRGADPAQRTLLNFDIVDPLNAVTIEAFKDQFKRLNGRNPSAVELSAYYRQHPQELARRGGGGKR
ncbi:MAG: hypothetical protein SA339_08805 [Methanomassiliicoccus sp.]|nr:hypothetical protein [Methanomassiliicoccus sp.]